MEPPQIRELHGDCVKRLEPVFEMMRSMDINFDEMVSGTEDKAGAEPDSPDVGMRRRTSSTSNRLMSEEQINLAKDRFLDDSQRALEDAIRMHSNIGGEGIPIWFWGVFAFFAYDDVFRMLLSPFLFYPTMLVVSVAALLYSMGLGPLFIPMAKSQVNKYARITGLGDVL